MYIEYQAYYCDYVAANKSTSTILSGRAVLQ